MWAEFGSQYGKQIKTKTLIETSIEIDFETGSKFHISSWGSNSFHIEEDTQQMIY